MVNGFHEIGKNIEGRFAESSLGKSALEVVDKVEVIDKDSPLARYLEEHSPVCDGPVYTKMPDGRNPRGERKPWSEIPDSKGLEEFPGNGSEGHQRLDEVKKADLAEDAEETSQDGADDAGDKGTDGEETSEFPTVKEVDGKKCYYDDNGNLYRVDNELCSNTNYELNGYRYQTDELGRIVSAEGTLHLKDRTDRLPIRDSLEDIGKGDQQEGDDRGHLVGDRFDGSNGMENMIPQNAEINRNDYKKFENELAKEVEEGKDVQVKIEPVYEGDSHRPTAIAVTYTVEGVENVRIFPNSKEENNGQHESSMHIR